INDSNETDEWTFMPDPVIKKVPQELLAQVGLESIDGFRDETRYSRVLDHPSAFMKWILDNDNRPLLVARFNAESQEWDWHKPTLRDAADVIGIDIGTFHDPNDRAVDTDLIARHFNLLQPGAFAWTWLGREGPDTIDFSLSDEWVDYAVRCGMKLRNGNTLIYHHDLPEWLNNYSNEADLKEIMKNRIQRTMQHYIGRVTEWVVCNESVWYSYESGTSGYENHIFYRVLGANYIDLAYQFAREADPSAKLIYNASASEVAGPQSDINFELVRRLKEKGLVDAVGLQYHVGSPKNWMRGNMDPKNFPNKEKLIETMKKYKDIGVEVIITELEVDVSGIDEEKFEKQAEIYRVITEAVLESGACKSISTWGYDDNTAPSGQESHLFKNGEPKLAYNQMIDVFLSSIG
ncbi:MAG: endo-1,4-beta-xylanase (glycosyl hydrolase family 10), endo-1,4-beta-xylanase, partial [Candidatus Gottesmanbacteria bacterium GW2011_GWA2_43_14]